MKTKGILALAALVATVGISVNAMADDQTHLRIAVANAGYVSANVPAQKATTVGVYTRSGGFRRASGTAPERAYTLVRKDAPQTGTRLLFVPAN